MISSLKTGQAQSRGFHIAKRYRNEIKDGSNGDSTAGEICKEENEYNEPVDVILYDNIWTRNHIRNLCKS